MMIARALKPQRHCSANGLLTRLGRMFSVHTEAIRNRYTDKVVIVTGGSRGIGEGCVRTFSEAGANVVFCGLEAHRELGEQLVERYTMCFCVVGLFVLDVVSLQEWDD